ncbi:MAG TPA: 5-formyltetrahydrofolate cyclo-ligase [Candidatus Borkfalkia excrementavium]|uniref:5-formyltetrahydrofolate cyclo-ligase n=1 Tax=Candidatus Borkfalkia excrementavium TaxID=2838505 RepID=A0A9D1Z6T2_9FIRM|nr:5-formyltetrahydrofolate cyclo-ligase [Candidatus Borkfalkia excrementavium]
MNDANEKRELRRRMKRLRAEDERRAERDAKIAEYFFTLPDILSHESFFIYNSFSTEADTSRMIARLLSEGKRVSLPRVEGKDMVSVPYVGQALVKSPYGILEPEGEADEEVPEVCVLPLLAADRQFNRLGYGGGFYDRFLSLPHVYKVGVCYEYQILEKIPSEPHDVRLDALVTDAGVILRRKLK